MSKSKEADEGGLPSAVQTDVSQVLRHYVKQRAETGNIEFAAGTGKPASKLVKKQHRRGSASTGVKDAPGAQSERAGFHVDENEQQVSFIVERDGSGTGTVSVACANG